MKIDRLIGILSLLLQKDKITSSELAQKFEVSRRTILRDIDSINNAGIPILTTQGQGGGISIMKNFKIDRTLLSSEEMKAILTGLQSLDSISKTNHYRQLMEKLSAPDFKQLNTDNPMIIDLSVWDKSAVSYKIDLIQSAMKNSEKISFTYFSPNGQTLRELEPYHLIFQWSNWYIWGYCTTRKDYRMFKLTRLTDLKCTGESYKKRNIPAYFSNKLLHTKSEIEAVVKFDSSIKWRLIDEFDIHLLKEDQDGNLYLTFTWSDTPSFFHYILTFGNKAEIISPIEYRQSFAALVKEISEKYEI